LALQAALNDLEGPTLPLEGSANRAKQTAAAKAAAERKKLDKANKAAANKLMVAEAAAHAEALKQARAFKAGAPLTLAPASPFSTPAARAELLRACVDAYRSAPARQLVSEADEKLLGSIRSDLAPIALSCDDIIQELRSLIAGLEARPSRPDALETIAAFIERHIAPLPARVESLEELLRGMIDGQRVIIDRY
jgi:hypothetical protein